MKRFKDVFIGVLIGCMVMATPVLADSTLTQIDVVLNGVNVQVEGEDIQVESILYNGITFLPMRKVAELVDKNIEWNADTKTANIVEKEEIKEGDDLTENTSTKNEIIEFENGIMINSEMYYEYSYIQDSISSIGSYSIYSTNLTNKEIKLTLSKFSGLGGRDEGILIESIPYETVGLRTYISKDYYENTILPLIK